MRKNIEELSRIKSKSVKFNFSTVVTKANESELDDIKSKLDSYGFSNWAPGGMCYYMMNLAKEEDIKKITSFIPDNIEYRNRLDMQDGKIITPEYDYCGNIIPSISVDGDVTICCHDMLHRLNMGNIIQAGSLRKIINGKKYKEAVRKGRDMKLDMCKGCS